jgi:DGQHR domain-containing protein
MAAARKRSRKRKASKERLHFPALDVSHNDTILYQSVVKVRTLFPLCFVSRVEEDPEHGYQRLLGKQRPKQIAAYLDSGKVIPGSIVLSAQPEAELEFDRAKGEISFLRREAAFLVVDGQHRLYGAHLAKGDVPIVISILMGLDREEEVTYFLDVNSKQIGVPKTLQIEITKFLVEEGSLDETRIKLFKELNTRPESPLCGRMSAAQSKVGTLSHVPFKAALDPLLSKPPLSKADFEQKVQILINFLSALEELLVALEQQDKLWNAAFFTAVFGAFRDIAAAAFQRFSNYKIASFAEVIHPLRNIDWAIHSGTNKKAIATLSQHITDLVADQDTISNAML